jgi:HAD superfamily hydrolase (TIGR01549 family)
MNNQIKAILFDMGGTLRRSVQQTEEQRHKILQRVMDLIQADGPVADFAHLLAERAISYKQWAEQTRIELSESDLWTKWMLPDFPSEEVSAIAVQLNQLYRESTGVRTILPESREVILELFRRGYRLGLVSNTTSSVEIPALLKELEVTGCFETVILSTVVGKRKPDPAILLEATQRMGIDPGHCAFIGDRVERDVAAARETGFSKAIILRDAKATAIDRPNGSNLASDHVIDNLNELLEIFAPQISPQPDAVYDASLSTMWAINTFPRLTDFFEFARRAGFARIELNHKVTSAMLEGIELHNFQVSSIHEPCPADISVDELKRRDWLISSTDENHRREGVKSVRRSIDLASQLGASVVVVHAGHVCPESGLEKRLRALLAAGEGDSDEYRKIQRQMIETRAEGAEAAFASVRKSILELLAYAESSGVRLGIENRYHFLEIPSPNELESLLSLAGPERIGFLYDVGHAEVLDHLGFYPHEEWLQRFASRITGTHLHDVRGTKDHFAPGLGDVNFDMVTAYLPDSAFRTCEFQNTNTPQQVKAGLKFLVEKSCIKPQNKKKS